MKNYLLLAIMLIMMVGVSSQALAFGISVPYFRDNPLYMFAGEEKTINIQAQNMIGTKAVMFKVSIKNGDRIANFIDIDDGEFITLALGQKRDLPIKIIIPVDAEIDALKNDKKDFDFQIAVEMESSSPNGEGQVQFEGATRSLIPVIIVPEQEVVNRKIFTKKVILWSVAGIVLLILLVFASIFMVKRKRRKHFSYDEFQ